METGVTLTEEREKSENKSMIGVVFFRDEPAKLFGSSLIHQENVNIDIIQVKVKSNLL